jgi:hypothetical protein
MAAAEVEAAVCFSPLFLKGGQGGFLGKANKIYQLHKCMKIT